jgi:hypothetical protein
MRLLLRPRARQTIEAVTFVSAFDLDRTTAIRYATKKTNDKVSVNGTECADALIPKF